MDIIDSIVAIIPQLVPEPWLEVIAALFLLLVALRTGLRALSGLASAIDVAIDGKADWTWPAKLEAYLVKVDGYLARLPVKAPWLLERREHARPAKRSAAPWERP